MNKRIFIVLSLIVAISAFLIWIITRDEGNLDTRGKLTNIVGQQDPKDLDICNKLSSEDVRDIFGDNYKKPNITKTSINGGLSSDTCSFSPVESTGDNVQIVMRYTQNNDNLDQLRNHWNQLKDTSNEKNTISGMGKEAFSIKNTLHILQNSNILTITKTGITHDQGKKILQTLYKN